MPWYGQVAAFAVLGARRGAAPSGTSTRRARSRRSRRSGAARRRCTPRSIAVMPPSGGCPSSVASWPASKRRCRGCARCCPTSATSPICCAACRGWRRSRSLTILGFTPQAVTKKTMYVEWPIGLKLEGTYHDLGLFLERVSKFPRIINVSNLKVKALDKSCTLRRRRSPRSCTATTFVLVEQPKAARPATPGGLQRQARRRRHRRPRRRRSSDDETDDSARRVRAASPRAAGRAAQTPASDAAPPAPAPAAAAAPAATGPSRATPLRHAPAAAPG